VHRPNGSSSAGSCQWISLLPPQPVVTPATPASAVGMLWLAPLRRQALAPQSPLSNCQRGSKPLRLEICDDPPPQRGPSASSRHGLPNDRRIYAPKLRRTKVFAMDADSFQALHISIRDSHEESRKASIRTPCERWRSQSVSYCGSHLAGHWIGGDARRSARVRQQKGQVGAFIGIRKFTTLNFCRNSNLTVVVDGRPRERRGQRHSRKPPAPVRSAMARSFISTIERP